jgi:plasmid stability protein
MMANLQVKGIDDGLYEQLKRLATTENRSVSQEIIFLVKAHLSSQKVFSSTPSPAEVLLQLSGSWEDPRQADEIVAEIKNARKNSQRLVGGL